MDKCIKIELPTGHVLLKRESDGFYHTIDDNGGNNLFYFLGCRTVDITESRSYKGWVDFSVSDNTPFLFKVIAQYGDEFPV